MTRTTLNIEPSVLDELKERAHREGRSLGAVASELIRRALREKKKPAKKFEWKVYDLGPAAIDTNDWATVKAFLYDEDDKRLVVRD
jgi:hypothetical protein